MKKSAINTIHAADVAAVALGAAAGVHAVAITIPTTVMNTSGPAVQAFGTNGKYVYARGYHFSAITATSNVYHYAQAAGDAKPIYSLSVRVTCGNANYSTVFTGNGVTGSANETCSGRGNYVSAAGNVYVLN